MDTTMQQRREEILAKKAKLAELKKQRELRREQTAARQSMGSPSTEVQLSTKLPRLASH
jgi:dynein intermediate chain